jgi:uncharacterized tellurite resistance protein B-like protein
MPATGKSAVADTKSAAEAFQQKLSDALMSLFEIVLTNRRGYYAKHPEKIPFPHAFDAIIDKYSIENAAISGGFNLVPGPWGLVGIIPELTLIFKNQLMLIYDIGMAHEKSEVLTKELLAGILLDAFGIGAGSLFVMHGSKLIVKRVSLRVFQRIITLLAGRVTQQALKSALSRWVPVLGAAAMAAWVHYMTKKVGRRAVEILSKDIAVDETELDQDGTAEWPDGSEPTDPDTASLSIVQRLRILACLAAIDGQAHEQEAAYIKEILGNYNIPASEKDVILHSLEKCQPIDVDFTVLANNPSDSVGVLVDMVALSKRDGSLHPAEKIYVRKVGQILGVAEADVDDLIEVG